MDNDRVKGKMKDIGGRIERQVGEWTGDKDAQAEGAADQAEGKVQNSWGKLKDAGRDAIDKMKDSAERKDRDLDRDKDVA
jgi:uncharacterized protein YjbJ (UPF0337 family)